MKRLFWRYHVSRTLRRRARYLHAQLMHSHGGEWRMELRISRQRCQRALLANHGFVGKWW